MSTAGILRGGSKCHPKGAATRGEAKHKKTAAEGETEQTTSLLTPPEKTGILKGKCKPTLRKAQVLTSRPDLTMKMLSFKRGQLITSPALQQLHPTF